MPRKVTVEFSDEAYAAVGFIETKLGLPNKSEAVRKALGLLKFVIEEREAGKKLILEKPAERKEITDF